MTSFWVGAVSCSHCSSPFIVVQVFDNMCRICFILNKTQKPTCFGFQFPNLLKATFKEFTKPFLFVFGVKAPKASKKQKPTLPKQTLRLQISPISSTYAIDTYLGQ